MYSDPITNNYYMKLESQEHNIQNAFISKVYIIVFCQLLCSTVFSTITYTYAPLKLFAYAHPEFLTISFGCLLSCITFIFCSPHMQGFIGYTILSIFTLSQSYILGIMCTAYDPVSLLSALSLTSVTTASLTIYVYLNKHENFTWLYPLLGCGSLSIISLIIFTWIFGETYFTSILFGTFGSLLFSGYLVFDTYYILTRYTPEDYIIASLNLYLDIINLFISFLRLTSSRNDI